MDRGKELAALNQIIDELLATLKATMESGEELSDEFQGMLAQELDATYSRIEQLQGEVQGPPPPDAQLLWILSGQNPDAFVSYLQQYPSEATKALLANPSALSSTIRNLSQMMPKGQPLVIDDIPHAGLQSSNIWGSTYNPKTRQMRVRFQEGGEYEYDGIPPEIYRAFSSGNASAKTSGFNRFGRWWPNKNPSLGAALNQYIKAGKFKYRKIK